VIHITRCCDAPYRSVLSSCTILRGERKEFRMAAPAIVWRNPKNVQRARRWTHVMRDANRSLYLVLESTSHSHSSWDGLPTLEVIQGRAAASPKNTAAKKRRFLTGA